MGESKFSEEIENHQPSKGFKQPELTKYGAASGDLHTHIQEFEKQLILYSDEYLRCNMFPITI